MPVALAPRSAWALSLCAIIAAGIGSRLAHTGVLLLDKYLGDALYAAMFYVILRACRKPTPAALWAMLAMTVIECFQLTGIPAHLFSTGHPIIRLVARLLGTGFSLLDLLAYVAGIACLWAVESARQQAAPHSA